MRNLKKKSTEFDQWEFNFLLDSHYFDIWVEIVHYHVRKGWLYQDNLEKNRFIS